MNFQKNQLQSRSKRRYKRRGRANPLRADSLEWAQLTSRTLWQQLRSELKAYYDFDLNPDTIDAASEQYTLQKMSLLRYYIQS